MLCSCANLFYRSMRMNVNLHHGKPAYSACSVQTFMQACFFFRSSPCFFGKEVFLMSARTTLVIYLFFIVATPLLAQWNYFRNTIVPRISYTFYLSQIPGDPSVVSVGFVTFYVHVFLGIVKHVFQSFERMNNGRSLRNLARLERAHAELSELFPGSYTATWACFACSRSAWSFFCFSVCCIHIAMLGQHQSIRYTQNRVNKKRRKIAEFAYWMCNIRFLAIETAWIIILPLTHFVDYGGGGARSVCLAAYRCALFWTLMYGIMPRETSYLIYQTDQVLQEYGLRPLLLRRSAYVAHEDYIVFWIDLLLESRTCTYDQHEDNGGWRDLVIKRHAREVFDAACCFLASLSCSWIQWTFYAWLWHSNDLGATDQSLVRM